MCSIREILINHFLKVRDCVTKSPSRAVLDLRCGIPPVAKLVAPADSKGSPASAPSPAVGNPRCNRLLACRSRSAFDNGLGDGAKTHKIFNMN